MFTAAELAEHQADAESLMVLCFQAEVPGMVLDDKNRKIPGFEPFGAPCIGKIAGSSTAARDTPVRTLRVGAVTRPVLEGGLHLPVGAFVVAGVLQIVMSEDPAAAWRLRVVGSRLGDPSMVGRKYQVVGVPAKPWATARRLDVVEV